MSDFGGGLCALARPWRVFDRVGESMTVESEKKAQAVSGSEKRVSRRKSTRIPGQIFQGRKVPLVACTIRDTSATGAMVELWQGTQKPFTRTEPVGEHFTLIMTADFMEVDCEIAWRKGGTLGVRYLSALRMRPRPVKQKTAEPQDNSLLGRLLTQGKALQGRTARR